MSEKKSAKNQSESEKEITAEQFAGVKGLHDYKFMLKKTYGSELKTISVWEKEIKKKFNLI